jgi:hypothetical protein
VGKAGKKNTPKEEPALEEARERLRFLHGLGALDDDPRRARARAYLKMIEFPVGFSLGCEDAPLTDGEPSQDEAEHPPQLNLRDYLLRLLDEKPARAKEGRPANVARDFWIVQVLARLVVMYGVPLTRSRRRAVRPRRLSACAIVAQALGEVGIKLDEAGVEAVWSKRRPYPQLSASEIDKHSSLPRTIELDQRDRKIIDAAIKAEKRAARRKTLRAARRSAR